MAKVYVKIDKTGTKVTTRVEGVAGSACTSLTDALNKALGEVTNVTPTEEMYQSETSTEVQTEVGG